MSNPPFKPLDEVQAAIARRFEATLADEAAGITGSWPWRVALGHPSRRELVDEIARVGAYVTELRDWADRFDLDIEWESRIAGGPQQLPTHVAVSSIDIAAQVAGADAPRRLSLMRARANAVRTDFPQLEEAVIARVLRLTRTWTDFDFSLLLQAGEWFGTHNAAGMTPRQVPLEGFHAKWLDSGGRRAMVALLAGKDDLGLVGRPQLVELAYLDPVWRASGGRHYDAHVMGDVWALPYEPSIVLVVENKDTYLAFPELAGAICLFGAGRAGVACIPRIGWVSNAGKAALALYWGDMDADGLEILDAYRAAGLTMRSILMDIDAFRRYERLGTAQAAGKRSLESHTRLELGHLTPGEQELYNLITDPAYQGVRRIEQERIPLEAALSQISREHLT